MDDDDKQSGPRFLDMMSSSGSGSSNNKGSLGLKFWQRNTRKRRLGSQDITLHDRPGDGEATASVADGQTHEYRTYKRRWFGLVQLTLMNIVVSWGVSDRPIIRDTV